MSPGDPVAPAAADGLRSHAEALRTHAERLRRSIAVLGWTGTETAALARRVEELAQRCTTAADGLEASAETFVGSADTPPQPHAWV